MLCASPGEAGLYWNEDGGGANREGIGGKGRGQEKRRGWKLVGIKNK